MMKPILQLALALCALMPISSASAAKPQPFLGRWLIAEARPAPWVVPGDATTAPVTAPIVGRAIVYERASIAGPRLLACRRPNYQLQQVPPEGLFQGGLTAPAAQASALGFRGGSIPTLQTGCAGAIDFHFVDQSTALFALDNMVYTIRKQAR